jgi:hypothetical protein
MPFRPENMVPIGSHKRARPGTGEATMNGAVTLWLYRTEDAPTVVDAAGYFNAHRMLLLNGDVILRVTINSAGTAQSVGFHVVNDVPATGNVDVTDTLALTMTDTR